MQTHTHAHTRKHTLSLSLSLSFSHFRSLSFSHIRTHARTHAHTYVSESLELVSGIYRSNRKSLFGNEWYVCRAYMSVGLFYEILVTWTIKARQGTYKHAYTHIHTSQLTDSRLHTHTYTHHLSVWSWCGMWVSAQMELRYSCIIRSATYEWFVVICKVSCGHVESGLLQAFIEWVAVTCRVSGWILCTRVWFAPSPASEWVAVTYGVSCSDIWSELLQWNIKWVAVAYGVKTNKIRVNRASS